MKNLKKFFNKKLILVALLVTALGAGTSLAYFSDQEESKANLKIQFGTLNTKIVESINIEGLNIDNIKADDFSIKNTGTLKQKLTFNFDNPINIEKDGLDRLNYEIVFHKANGEASKVYSGIITELFEGPIDIVSEDEEPIILDSDEVLIATIKIDMDKAMPYKYSNKEFNFDMVIDAFQINFSENKLGR